MKNRDGRKTTLLIVDDEPLVLELLTRALGPEGYRVLCAADGRAALNLVSDEAIDLAVIDYSLPDICGGELFDRLRAVDPELPAMILTGHPNLETAVDLMKSGIRDYMSKPFSLAEVSRRIHAILERIKDEETLSPAGARDGKLPAPASYIFGNSPIMREVEAQVRSLPRYPETTVLITGPTGTGKTAVARRIHELSCGSAAPFVEIDCSTIPHELCESELFGHEKGSFTGAHAAKEGLFEAAGCGTAFLDEIGELDARLQVKFLRVLEARQFKRVGGHSMRPMSARIIAATNRSLPDLVRAGRFREDLYFRLNVIELWMPPLRERADDILMLAQHFLRQFADRHQKRIAGFTLEALEVLRKCDFPGNVRELRNLIERAIINTNTSEVDASHLAQNCQELLRSELSDLPIAPHSSGPSIQVSASGRTLADMEYSTLHEALKLTQGNKSKAAQMVGLSRTAFHRRLQKHDRGSGHTLHKLNGGAQAPGTRLALSDGTFGATTSATS